MLSTYPEARNLFPVAVIAQGLTGGVMNAATYGGGETQPPGDGESNPGGGAEETPGSGGGGAEEIPGGGGGVGGAEEIPGGGAEERP
ncbi:MAG TPA: hypothetical protein VF521_02015 [Pyrinomonadaceae bacterium]|jgi:hypothetical protein